MLPRRAAEPEGEALQVRAGDADVRTRNGHSAQVARVLGVEEAGMNVGDVVGIADWINRECARLGADESTRGWCHELHGKCRAAGGDDDEIRISVRAFLEQRHGAAARAGS